MNDETKICLVSNIPKDFSASHLRNYFIKFIDLGLIEFFNYRHRPAYHELASFKNTINAEDLANIIRKKNRTKEYCLGFIKIKEKFLSKFINIYDNSYWIDKKNNYINQKCKILTIVGSFSTTNLIEFKSKNDLFPKGNVGTSTSFFLDQIKACKLFSSVIRKLDIDFNKHTFESKFREVPFNYLSDNKDAQELIIRDDRITKLDEDCEYDAILKSDMTEPKDKVPSKTNDCPEDDVPEEWERFEALHNDPYNLTRHSRANIKYEDEIEKKWEKGGSGLVHYTDQMYWNALETVRRDEFFNEPASFDIDVSLERYDDNKIVEKPSVTSKIWSQKIHEQIPKSNKGYQILKKIGWAEGDRLGPKLDPNQQITAYEEAVGISSSKRNRGLLYPLTMEKESIIDDDVKFRGLGYNGSKKIDLIKGKLIEHVIFKSNMLCGHQGISFVKQKLNKI